MVDPPSVNHLSVNVLYLKKRIIRWRIVYETTAHVQVLRYPLAHGDASDLVVKGKIQMLFHMIEHGREPTRIPPKYVLTILVNGTPLIRWNRKTRKHSSLKYVLPCVGLRNTRGTLQWISNCRR